MTALSDLLITPYGWRIGRLKHVLLRTIAGGTPATGNDDNCSEGEDGVPWVSISDMTKAPNVLTTEKNITKPALLRNRLEVLPAGTLLYSMYASLGKVAELGIDAVTNQAILGLIPKHHIIDKRFLTYWLQNFERHLSYFASSNTQDNLNAEKVWNIPILLPELSEQLCIAAWLDQQTRKIDQLINMRRRQMALLKEQRAALIQQVVTHGLNPNASLEDSGLPWLGEIPAHWEVKRNKFIFCEIDSRSVDGSEELLSVSHITGVTPRAQKEEVNMFLAESNEGYKRVEVGDLAINTMWAWMGALGFSNYSGIVSPSYNVYRFRTEAVSAYYDLLFRSPNFTKEIIRHSTGVWESRLRLYPQAFFEIRSPVPPLEEQRAIVSYVEKTTGETEKVLNSMSRQLILLEEYRAALIHECVTGRRRVGEGLIPRSHEQIR